MKVLILFIFLFFGFQTNETKCNQTHVVTATVYTVNPNDGKQSYTASGIAIDEEDPHSHKIIAISRDLQQFYNFGDKVLITGTEYYDGEYVVEDLMASYWTNKIDILINNEHRIDKFYSIKICKLPNDE